MPGSKGLLRNRQCNYNISPFEIWDFLQTSHTQRIFFLTKVRLVSDSQPLGLGRFMIDPSYTTNLTPQYGLRAEQKGGPFLQTFWAKLSRMTPLFSWSKSRTIFLALAHTVYSWVCLLHTWIGPVLVKVTRGNGHSVSTITTTPQQNIDFSIF